MSNSINSIVSQIDVIMMRLIRSSNEQYAETDMSLLQTLTKVCDLVNEGNYQKAHDVLWDLRFSDDGWNRFDIKSHSELMDVSWKIYGVFQRKAA